MSQIRFRDQDESTAKKAALVRPLLVVSAMYLANAGVGTWLAVRHGLSGSPFGWETGLTPLYDLVFGLGTALSAPLVLLLTLIVLNLLIVRRGRGSRRAASLLALLGAGFLTGILAEPIVTDALDSAFSQPVQAGVVTANVLLPMAMMMLAFRVRAGLHPVAAEAR